MNNTTDDLIASLSEGMETVKPTAHPVTLFAIWLGISVIYAAVLLCFGSLRHDLAAQLHAPAYLAEILLLAALVITCGLSATALSFPDMHQKRWLLHLPMLPLAGFVGMMAFEYFTESIYTPMPPHGVECTLCIAMYSFLPALVMMLTLRKQASTNASGAGAVALLASASIGCLALRLSEETDAIHHLVLWHYLPMVGFALAGVIIGKNLLKW